MNARDRVLAALNHQETDRVPIHDSPWAATVERWHKEGMPIVNPAEYFDYEVVSFAADTSPRFPVEVVRETEEYIVNRTPYGGLRRDHKDYSTTPEIIDYPCKSRADWERIKGRLTPSRERVDWEGQWMAGTIVSADPRGEESVLERGRRDWRRGLPGCRKAREQGRFICYNVMVGYDKLQFYVATEQLLMAIATEPDWVRNMYEVDADLAIAMFEIMSAGGFQFDGIWLTCDLGYRNGLLFSPRHYDEQLRPTLRRLFQYFKGKGLPVILHSCGCVRDLIPRFIEDGLTCLQPLEVKAGMDVIALKRAYGDKLAFMGGIDVRAMADPDPAVIEEEIKTKITFAKRGGGYLYHSDHSVPNNVSLERYQHVLELVKRYGGYS
jgi:uroporphyrinogen decarboxylase